MRTLLNLDWLTLSGKTTAPEYVPHYRLGGIKNGGRIFSKCRSVIYKGKEIAVFVSCPCSPILARDTAQITFRNWVLYDFDVCTYITNICRVAGFYPVSVTRLDVACDFQCFRSGIAPTDFIKRFALGKYVKNGGGNFGAMGKCGVSLEIETLTFGKRASGIYCRLYNKSREQEEGVKKEWITKQWEQIGFNLNKPVWRLEFELRGKSIKLLDKETGEIGKLVISSILSRDYIINLFKMLVRDYFDFRIKTNDKNKSRWKRLDTFDFECCELVRVRAVDYERGGLREKILLKNLHLFYERYGTDNLVQANEIGKIAERLEKMTGLGKWVNKHIDDWKYRESLKFDTK